MLLVHPSQAQQASVQTLEGTIDSEGLCGKDQSAEEASKKILECIAKGQGWVLVTSDKTYRLEGRMSGISNLAGRAAKVTGRVVGDRLVVRSVDPASS
jgi:hypothetical protein